MYVITMRTNKALEQVVKIGIEMSRHNHNLSAVTMMINAGAPYIIVDRVLYESHKVRSTD